MKYTIDHNEKDDGCDVQYILQECIVVGNRLENKDEWTSFER